MFQHPNTFGYSMWKQDFETILKLMPTDTDNQREAIPRMIGLQKYLQVFENHNWPKIQKLHTYLDELDRRRGTDWRSIFPYLDISESGKC
jgi:hypothetical protein